MPSYSMVMPVASSNGAKAPRNASRLSPLSTPSTLTEPPICASSAAELRPVLPAIVKASSTVTAMRDAIRWLCMVTPSHSAVRERAQ